MAKETAAEIFERWRAKAEAWMGWLDLAQNNACIRDAVAATYVADKTALDKAGDLNIHGQYVYKNFQKTENAHMYDAANYVWVEGLHTQILMRCAGIEAAKPGLDNIETSHDTDINYTNNVGPSPFDRRLDRIEEQMANDGLHAKLYTPFSSEFKEVTSSGYLMSNETIRTLPDEATKNKLLTVRDTLYNKLKADDFYYGVPALQNTYALIRLYGSNAGSKLINQKNERRWYEVDTSPQQAYNYASTPTTSALIDWGNGDPYGRTPYHFTDFVFAKYWNKIANNRLITLRRYPAPILDNLKFPGMKGGANYGSTSSDINEDRGTSSDETTEFAPMASAITYLGGDTGNSLNNLLKFTTGVLWEPVQAAIWEVTADSVPSSTDGLGKIFPAMANMAKLLDVATGNFDPTVAQNDGQLPPDPYKDGPFENRIQGPINRIDAVTKRKPGMKFEMDTLNLTFEYVARPVGGINPKAVLLDILSNFLVIGSASAVFFGGAHRFMAAPAAHPLIGSSNMLYKGDVLGYSKSVIQKFTGDGGSGTANAAFDSIWKTAKMVFSQLFSGEKGSGFGAFTSLFTGAGENLIKNAFAHRTAGQVPYLSGLKAILTGEPVGEWHITIGNPLNPIAMIGNLVCDGVTVEFNDELGPDDFPTEIKIIVSLKHAMARDKDAIESMFNRGMGRIYNLPDSLGSSDYETVVDAATGKDKGELRYIGSMPKGRMGVLYQQGMDSRNIPKSQLEARPNVLAGSVSVWNREAFRIGISENSNATLSQNELFKSSYRTSKWIAKKAHS